MQVTFTDAIKLFYQRWKDFDGCSSRSEYWYVSLFMLIASVVFICLGKTGETLSGLFSLVNLIPGIAISIRRMHDIGKSGWWILINLLPIIGWIWYIILAVTPSKYQDNPYRA